MDCNFSAWFAQLENWKKKPDGLARTKKWRTLKNKHCVYICTRSESQLLELLNDYERYAEPEMLWIQANMMSTQAKVAKNGMRSLRRRMRI